MHNKQTMMISVDGILILELHSLHCQGAMIFLFFGKCSIFTQDLLCVTLTKRYGLMWNPVEHFPKISCSRYLGQLIDWSQECRRF